MFNFVAALILSLCLQGCTTYQTVTRGDADESGGGPTVRSLCSDLTFTPGRDLQVGDDIRYQTCGGRSAGIKVTGFDSAHVEGNGEVAALNELKSLEIKKLSLPRTVLLGLAGGTVALASVAFVFSAVFVTAWPHIFLHLLFG